MQPTTAAAAAKTTRPLNPLHAQAAGINMTFYNGDCRAVLAQLPAGSVDAIVTDPPYGIAIGGAKWDDDIAHRPETWQAILRVIAPHGIIMSFAAVKTWDLIGYAIRQASGKIFDGISYIYSTGFSFSPHRMKPSWEPIICVCKKESTGALQINDAYIPAGEFETDKDRLNVGRMCTNHPDKHVEYSHLIGAKRQTDRYANRESDTRKAANVVTDYSDAVRATMINRQGESVRYFYGAKVRQKQRHYGMPDGATNNHPTVKPRALMEYLCKLAAPAGATILDPFMGSGSTGIAATQLGNHFIGIEQDKNFYDIACARVQYAANHPQDLIGNPRPTSDKV